MPRIRLHYFFGGVFMFLLENNQNGLVFWEESLHVWPFILKLPQYVLKIYIFLR